MIGDFQKKGIGFGDLPEVLSVNGNPRSIRSDFRDILNIIMAFDDPDLEDREKVYVCLVVLYEDFEDIDPEDYEEAFKAAVDFIDQGTGNEEAEKKHPRTMDWAQDENLLFPAVNKVAGFETRTVEYLHWWTFIGYFMEITDGAFATILSLRTKKAKHKPLEKWEQEFWRANNGICALKERLSAEEQAERDRLNELLG